jgi:hypothetical protein
LSPADKAIWAKFNETGDPRFLTGWYFEWEPHPKQLKFLVDFLSPWCWEGYLTTGSRWGKSDELAIADSLLAMRNAGKGNYVCNASITQDQAEIVFNKAESFLYTSPRCAHWLSGEPVRNPFPTIRFAHGAELWARSTQYKCKYIRGWNFVGLSYDEVAHGNSEDMEVLRLRTVDKGGKFLGGTTPKRKNWYYREIWRPALNEIKTARANKQQPRVALMTGTSYDNPHINHEALDHARLTERQRKQEIEGMFLDDEGAPFTAEQIEASTNADLNDNYNKILSASRVKEWKAEPGKYIVGWDLAKKATWCVGTVLRVDCTPWKLEWWERFQRKPWPEVERIINENQRQFSSTVALDATGVGDPTKDHLDVPFGYLREFIFTPKSKTELITNLQYCMEKKLFQMPYIKQLQDELYNYEWDDKQLETDCVMSLGLACWEANSMGPPLEMY